MTTTHASRAKMLLALLALYFVIGLGACGGAQRDAQIKDCSNYLISQGTPPNQAIADCVHSIDAGPATTLSPANKKAAAQGAHDAAVIICEQTNTPAFCATTIPTVP